MATTTTPFSNKAMSEEQITEVMRSFIKRGATMRIRTITEVRLNKSCPFKGDCFKDSTSLYESGISYNARVKGKMARLGLDPASFEAESNWFEHDDDICVINVHPTTGRHYISLVQEAGTWRETHYLHADGREYTQYEMGLLQPYLPTYNGSKKQGDAGIPNEEQIRYLTPDVRNVMEIKQGEELQLTHEEEQQVIC